MARLTAVLLSVALCGGVLAAGPLDFGGQPPDQIVVSWRSDAPARIHDSAMLNRLEGVAFIADGGRTRRLAIASRAAAPIGWPAELPVLGFLHAKRGEESRVCAFGRTSDGIVIVRDGPGSESAAFEFDGAPWDELLDAVDVYSGPVPAGRLSPADGILPRPYRPSRIILDESTVRERLAGGRRTSLGPTERSLPDELIAVRTPEGGAEDRPLGLLVWVSATPEGTPPPHFFEVADELGLLIIGAADAGNARNRVDRYQLALDGVAMARRHWHIDDRRIYVTGISGGGRISSDLAACFPEVFTGSVPIVGIHTHRPVPLGDGRFIPAGYRQPEPARWRLFCQHRMAAVTGPLDFNYREIVNAVRILQRGGVPARLFEYEDMAHTLPTPERFAEALRWVDAPVREADAAGAAEAEELLARYLAKYGEVEIRTEGQHRMLEQVTSLAPWTEPAWAAARLLGVAPVPTQPEP